MPKKYYFTARKYRKSKSEKSRPPPKNIEPEPTEEELWQEMKKVLND